MLRRYRIKSSKFSKFGKKSPFGEIELRIFLFYFLGLEWRENRIQKRPFDIEKLWEIIFNFFFFYSLSVVFMRCNCLCKKDSTICALGHRFVQRSSLVIFLNEFRLTGILLTLEEGRKRPLRL